LYGFVPYWEMDESIAAHIAGTPLTTLALFSVTHQRDGELDEAQQGILRIRGGVGESIIAAAREAGMRIELTYTSFGERKNERFYTEPEAQARWIEVLVDLVAELDLDGVNVDVELLPREFVDDYGDFVGRLGVALRARVEGASLSVATASGPRGASMAAAAAAAGADRIFLMGYDYHWEGSQPGASSPMDRLDGEPNDLVWSLDLYGEMGVPTDSLLLGLPLYGVTWPVEGPGVGMASTGRGDDWVPRHNLRVFEDAATDFVLDEIEVVEYYAVGSDAAGWDAVYFDSPRTLAPKLALADERGLAGAGFWAIGYERGLPEYTDLMTTFRAGDIAS
jgi:spore germination protein YaaH